MTAGLYLPKAGGPLVFKTKELNSVFRPVDLNSQPSVAQKIVLRNLRQI